MVDIITWVSAHWKDVLSAYGAIVIVCSTIVKLTPTQKDDNVWAKIVKVLDFFSTVFTKEDAAKIESAESKSKK